MWLYQTRPGTCYRTTERVTYGGQKVTLFHSSLVNGGSYTVKFTAMNGTTASVTGMTMPRTIKAQTKGWPLRFSWAQAFLRYGQK